MSADAWQAPPRGRPGRRQRGPFACPGRACMYHSLKLKTMFCAYCGAKLPDDAKFCTQCGRRMAESEKQTTQQMTAPCRPPSPCPPVPPQQKKEMSATELVIRFGFGAIVFILGSVLFLIIVSLCISNDGFELWRPERQIVLGAGLCVIGGSLIYLLQWLLKRFLKLRTRIFARVFWGLVYVVMTFVAIPLSVSDWDDVFIFYAFVAFFALINLAVNVALPKMLGNGRKKKQ